MKPLVIGIGGSPRAGSTGELALLLALQAAEESGARTQVFNGAFLASLPIYAPENTERTEEQIQLVEVVRSADGLILASPGYHGGISGSMKNALDLLEDLHGDRRAYLDGRAVGCIITAGGWQTVGIALTALRSIVHALRGWPTPLGAGINTSDNVFDPSGRCTDQSASLQLTTVGRQVVEFARKWA
jgi:FMN reductase